MIRLTIVYCFSGVMREAIQAADGREDGEIRDAPSVRRCGIAPDANQEGADAAVPPELGERIDIHVVGVALRKSRRFHAQTLVDHGARDARLEPFLAELLEGRRRQASAATYTLARRST